MTARKPSCREHESRAGGAAACQTFGRKYEFLDDDDDDDDDEDDDDDDDNSVGNELELVEQRKTQSSLLSLSSSLTSVKSIISAVAVRLADFNTTLPSQCTDLA